MSLSLSLSIATTGLKNVQTSLSVASSNIANADTTGYTKKTAVQTTHVVNGVGTSSRISEITSSVNQYLLKDISSALSSSGYASTKSEYLDSLATSLGTLTNSDSTSGNTLSTQVSDLLTALTALEETPDDETLQYAVVDALNSVSASLRSTSNTVQTLRANADEEISDTVTSVNDALHTIDKLNNDIANAKAKGVSTADLEDQRYQALQTVSSALGTTYFIADTGEMRVYTSSGVPLLDGEVHELSHTATANVNSATAYSSTGTSGFDAITVGRRDITESLSSGSLGALIELRDETLPAVQDQLDELATSLISTLNTINADASSSPPASSLTGTRVLSSTDALGGSGTLRVASTDASGKITAYSDLDLSSYATVGDLVTALNGISGVSASLNADGNLVISSSTSTGGVAINAMDSSVGGTSAGAYFGFNALLSGSGAEDIAFTEAFSTDNGLLASGKLSSSSSLAVGDTAVTSGDSSSTQAMVEALSSHTFSAAGGLTSRTSSFDEYASSILGWVTSTTDSASSLASSRSSTLTTLQTTFSSQSGVDTDEESANITLLENSYASLAQIVSTVNSMFNTLIEMMG